MPFRIDSNNLKWGFDSSVNLYKIELNERCEIKRSQELSGWFAAYVVVPEDCTQQNIVDRLITIGADYIFLNGQGIEPDFKLHNNGLTVPVFLTTDKAFAAFNTQTDEYFGVQSPDDNGNLYSKKLKIHVTLPLVKLRFLFRCF